MADRRVAIPSGALLAALLMMTYGAGLAVPSPTTGLEALEREVADTERAFAKTMSDRDHAAFTSFLSEEAVFFTGATPVRGKQDVAASWKPFFEGPSAPFSWAPEDVEVLDSGTLALSTGPVRDPEGKVIGTFTSIWRRDAPGTWRVVFDKGCAVCESCE
jgi:ketosteroid isomerase-like protein